EFSDVSNAIVSKNSSAVIHNNYFKNIIENSTWCPGCGVGILITNTTNATRIMDIGGSEDPLNHERNNFTNVNKGIYTTNVCHDCSLLVKGNSFNNDDFIYTTSSNFYNTAISIQNPYTTTRVTPYVEVSANTISDYRMGIHAENVFGILIGTNSTSDSYPNKIHFHLGATPTLTDHYIGILLQQCNSAIIRGSFEDPTSPNNTPDIDNDLPAVISGTFFKGIDIENSVNCRINCNNILNTPISIRFFSNNNGTLLRKNKMTEYDVAIWLDAATLPSQFQLDPTNISDPEDATNNEWYDSGGSNRIDGSTISGLPFQYNYDSVNNTGQYIPDPANFSVVSPEPDDESTVACDDFSNRFGRDELYGKVVDDSLVFSENIEENSYLANRDAFLSMQNDSNIIYQSNSRDSIYLTFYNQTNASNIALFDSVFKLAADTAYFNQAITLNSAIVDTNSIELYRKLANNIYLNTIAQNLPLDENDSLTCDETSSMDFFLAGDAIYTMAVMIGKEIHPQTVSLRIRLEDDEPKISTLPKFNLYDVLPNPISESFRIKGNTDVIKIMYLIGSDNKILRKYTHNFEAEISVNGITSGIYYFKIELLDSSCEFIKLIVIR
nr:hypothetical protein [Chitinophagaceae bacterium]